MSSRERAVKILVEVENLTKRFGAVVAIDDISLGLRENEFFALLGPSGCGKTTLLRAIAGFERPDAGCILLDGRDLISVRANHRPVNMMFQSYALFPHMTVRENVAYGLKMEGVRGAELDRRVDEALAMVQLGAYAKRKPTHLSGGERQRVALARALVKRPRLLLLDEPLAALDKKLRMQMQAELKTLQHEIGITFLFVTHDQEEALVMADRIALLNQGRIEQLGSGRELYEHPASHFVADFIGEMNFLRGRAAVGGVEVDGVGLLASDGDGPPPGAPAYLAVRPEKLTLHAADPGGGGNRLRSVIERIAYFGDDMSVHLRVEGCEKPMVAKLRDNEAEMLDLTPGIPLWIVWPPSSSRVLRA
jgi:spermidine/putrescine ABC transporter ATP-binding subunit